MRPTVDGPIADAQFPSIHVSVDENSGRLAPSHLKKCPAARLCVHYSDGWLQLTLDKSLCSGRSVWLDRLEDLPGVTSRPKLDHALAAVEKSHVRRCESLNVGIRDIIDVDESALGSGETALCDSEYSGKLRIVSLAQM